MTNTNDQRCGSRSEVFLFSHPAGISSVVLAVVRFYFEGAQNILTGSGALPLTEQAAAAATARYLQNLHVDVGQMSVIATNSQSILQSIYCKLKRRHGNMQPVPPLSKEKNNPKRRTAIRLLTPAPVPTL